MSEKELILSDGLICEVLKSEAQKAGVSLEDYVDKFLEVFYGAQDKLPKLNCYVPS